MRGDVLTTVHNDRRMLVIKQPVGVVAAITPWCAFSWGQVGACMDPPPAARHLQGWHQESFTAHCQWGDAQESSVRERDVLEASEELSELRIGLQFNLLISMQCSLPRPCSTFAVEYNWYLPLDVPAAQELSHEHDHKESGARHSSRLHGARLSSLLVTAAIATS